MVHAADEVVNTVMASVDERVLAVHDGHKSESRYIIKQVHSHLRLVTCAWSVSPDHAGEGAPSPLDKTLPSGISCSCLCLHALPPVPACTTACTCSTHILLDLSFAMLGSGGYFMSLVPVMSKGFIAWCCSRCCSLRGQQLSEHFQGNLCFYTQKS